jgi:hypothetical protein
MSEVLHRPLPTAGLPDAALAFALLDHGEALAEVVRERLLTVDVLLGARGLGGHDAVPVVGHAMLTASTSRRISTSSKA